MIDSNPTSFLKKTLDDAKLRSQLLQLAGSLDNEDQTMGWGIKWNPIKDIAKIANNVGKFINNAAIGLGKSIEGVGQSVFHNVEHFGETLALTARAAVGDVKWDRVKDELALMSRDVGNMFVMMNPARLTTDVLKKSELTSHAFNELDKFTGGLITNAVNVSDLPNRAMRGDAISKEELIKDAMFALQVVAVVVAGPEAPMIIGGMIGTMVGREVCKHQTEHQNECMLAFQITGALIGDYVTASEKLAYDQAVNQATKEAIKQCNKNKWAGSKECDILGNIAVSYVGNKSDENWNDFFFDQAQKQGLSAVLNEATKLAQAECKAQHWTGGVECDALANMLTKYLMLPEPKVAWENFAAEEIARLGVLSLSNRLIPKAKAPSPPPQPDFKIVYSDVVTPGETIVKKSNTGLVVAGAAGAAILLALGVS